jgi:glycosyltransferase involved in cell wall biosynthesis
MVTANRANLARRAIQCYLQQTYPNKELIIIDDGQEDYAPILADVPAGELRYIKLDPAPGQVLGTLRNRSLEEATGDFMAQWDDDDWYHPERIERQARVLMGDAGFKGLGSGDDAGAEEGADVSAGGHESESVDDGADACCLAGSLMHVDHPEYFDLPYVGYLPHGIPGTIMHRRNDTIRYPSERAGEDTTYLDHWLGKRYQKLPASEAGLFIRCFHGTNTWEMNHFVRRMRNSPAKLMRYLFYRYVIRDLSKNPLFRLDEGVRRAFETYLAESRQLGLFRHG